MAEPASSGGASTAAPLDAAWRAGAERAQSAALPRGRVAVSCPAPFGVGGLGRHLAETSAAVSRAGGQAQCLCEAGAGQGQRCLQPRPSPAWRALVRVARPMHAWRMWSVSAAFDAAAAGALPTADHLVCFNGTAAAQLDAARSAGYQTLSLMAANSHMQHVLRRHAAAHSRYPIEAPWATHLLARNLREYSAAERILVTSDYSWHSFLAQGISEERLVKFPLTPHPRFVPSCERPHASFDVLYVGALTVHKGVPLLIDAIRGLPFADLRLVLVGGWKTRGMRRFIETSVAADGRIRVEPGDPLAHMHRARVYVHPAYEDGFAYAPAEALACGLPVIVSEDTGMKELIESERHGIVLPTGEVEPLREAIAAAYRGEIFAG